MYYSIPDHPPPLVFKFGPNIINGFYGFPFYPHQSMQNVVSDVKYISAERERHRDREKEIIIDNYEKYIKNSTFFINFFSQKSFLSGCGDIL